MNLRHDLEYIEHMSPRLDRTLVIPSAWNTLLGRWKTRGEKRRARLGSDRRTV